MADVMETGTCTNERCAKSASGEQIERYPGPGEFCPECGEQLERSTTPPPMSLEAYRSFQERMIEAIASEGPVNAPPYANPLWIGISAAILFTMLIVLVRPTLVARTLGPAARVCTSTVTGALAAGVVRSYVTRSGAPASLYHVTPAGNAACDVRFRTVANGAGDAIAFDGIVLVVNPQNPLVRVSKDQARAIFGGRITDWSQLGGAPGAIEALLPDGGSDEANVLGSTLLRGYSIAPRVFRSSSADIVRRVVSASGRRAIGFVAYSEARSAKVLTIGAAPVPGGMTIADGTYPLTFAVVVDSDLRRPVKSAANLLAFARTDDARPIIRRTGLVPNTRF